MKKINGFTLIELIIFIIITSLLATTILLSLNTVGQKSSSVSEQTIATATATQCMEWLLGQRRQLNYSTLTCPSSVVPSFCTTPSGYTLAVSITCTTLNTDTEYKTLTVTVSGKGSVTLTSLIGDY